MVLFFITLISYVGILTGYRPYPHSLKAVRPTVWENVVQIKASILSGIVLIVIFLLVSNFSFITTTENQLFLFGINNFEFSPILFPLQLISHLLVHINLLHLVANVSALAILSNYERRVGSKRFLAVLSISSIASIPSILFHSDPAVICGISGGIFGLAAAYFTDRENMTTHEWIKSVGWFVLIAAIFTTRELSENRSYSRFELHIDYYGHILGAVGGIVYCRVQKKQHKQIKNT